MFLKQETYMYRARQKESFCQWLVVFASHWRPRCAGGHCRRGSALCDVPFGDAIKNTVLVHLQAMPFYVTLAKRAGTV